MTRYSSHDGEPLDEIMLDLNQWSDIEDFEKAIDRIADEYGKNDTPTDTDRPRPAGVEDGLEGSDDAS